MMETATEKPKVHIVDSYLLSPTNPIIVNLIGAGGTGSQVLGALVKTHTALLELGHPGVMVRLFDDDIISPSNRGRLAFTDDEVGLYKSVAFINRVNRFFGTDWKAVIAKFDAETIGKNLELAMAEITISCVDSVQARFDIAEILGRYRKDIQRHSPKYWIDYGNARDTGQVLLSTVGNIKQPNSQKYQTVPEMRFVTEEYGDLLRASETADNMPSCSVAEALGRQDLFINPTLAQLGGSLLWQMFREGILFNKGFFHNLKTFRTQPIPVA